MQFIAERGERRKGSPHFVSRVVSVRDHIDFFLGVPRQAGGIQSTLGAAERAFQLINQQPKVGHGSDPHGVGTGCAGTALLARDTERDPGLQTQDERNPKRIQCSRGRPEVLIDPIPEGLRDPIEACNVQRAAVCRGILAPATKVGSAVQEFVEADQPRRAMDNQARKRG
ncbi:MAG: hypothetical protein ACRELE_04130 [Gemmatimonadales bacterium]